MRLSEGEHGGVFGPRRFVDATVTRIDRDSGSTVVARLDEALTVGPLQGDVLLLRLRYVGAAWIQKEMVHVELWDREPPVEVSAEDHRERWVESHGTYEVLR